MYYQHRIKRLINFKESIIVLSHSAKLKSFLLSIALIGISCNKDINSSESEITNSGILDKVSVQVANLSDQLAYKEHHLLSLMETVLEQNPDLNKTLNFKASKDERPKVLLKNLLNNGSFAKSEQHPSLEAFTDLDGETWHPVIERVRKGTGNPKQDIYATTSFNQETGKEFVQAYHLKDDGQLVLIDDNYTESEFLQSASGKATPSVFSVTLTDCPIGTINDGCDLNPESAGASPSSDVLKIQKIRINKKRETWIEKADIEFQGLKISLQNGKYKRAFHISSSSSYANLDGRRQKMTKVSNSQLGNYKTVNFKIGRESAKSSFIFAIYEYDSWPAPRRRIDFSILPASCDCSRPDIQYKGYRSWYKDPYFNRVYSINRNHLTDGSIRPAFGKTFLSDDITSAAIKFSN